MHAQRPSSVQKRHIIRVGVPKRRSVRGSEPKRHIIRGSVPNRRANRPVYLGKSHNRHPSQLFLNSRVNSG